MLCFILVRRCGNKQHLIDLTLKFAEFQRAVILCRWQTESEIHQGRLSGLISGIHSADLRHCDMGLVHDHAKIIPKEIDQRAWRFPWFTPGQMPGIILDAGTAPGLPQHLYITIRSFRNPLCLDQLVIFLKIFHPLGQLLFDIDDGLLNLFLRHYVVGCRKYGEKVNASLDLSRENIKFHDPVDLVSKKLYPDSLLKCRDRKNLQNITFHPEGSPFKIQFVSDVLNIDQFIDHLIPVLLHTGS